MSIPSESQFEDLLSRYLDERLNPPQQGDLARALSDQSFAARFLEMTTLNAEIAGLLARPVPDSAMIDLVMRDIRGEPEPIRPYLSSQSEVDTSPSPTEPSVRRSRAALPVRRILAVAACLSLFALSIYWFSGAFQSAPASRLTAVKGKVAFIGSAGEAVLDGVQSLKGSGTLRTLGSESRATLMFADQTWIELSGDTSVVIDVIGDQPRLFLERGILRAHMTKEKTPRRLTFATQNAEATATGATFALMWDMPNSMVAVTEGKVSIRRLRDGHTVQVNAGDYAHVENGGLFFSWPLRALPKSRRDRLQFSN